MTTTPHRDVHASDRTARRRAARGRSRRGTGPGMVPAPTGVPAPLPVATATAAEARGFVVQVGLDESAASAAGTSLTRLAGQLRHYVESLVPGARSAAVVAIAPAGAPGPDLEVVRRVLGDPATGQGARPGLPLIPVPGSGLAIDLARCEVRLDGEVLDLTYKEFELLEHLVGQGGRPVGRGELIEALWRNAHEVPNERTIDVHMGRLRTKLGRLSGTVRTVRGQGYRFHEHPEVTVRTAPGHGG